jgi:predicted Ser/Thr protein kinase
MAEPTGRIERSCMDEAEFLNRRLGQILCGKWTLERLLGWGGMAAVYVGVHRIGRRDAIKILHEEVAISPETRGRFEQEAFAVNHLRHPGAVEVRDIDVTDEGCPFLVMELLEGESLASLLEKGELETPVLLGYIDEVLDVLVAAHATGIVHRDIKPDNLFICGNGRVKVLDFGVARMKEGAPRTLATRTGMAVGTLTYMAPEQVRGIHVDGRSDVFAVGATMFRCLARRRIHDGNTDADLLIKMATMPAPAILSVAPNTPPELALVVDRALQFDATNRYPDAQTMQADIRALMRGERPPYALARAATAAPGSSSDGSLAAGAAGAPSRVHEATRAEIPRPIVGAGVVAPSPVSTGQTAPMSTGQTAPMVEPSVSAPGVAPTFVDAATSVSEVRAPSKSKAPLVALMAGGAVLVLFLLLAVAVVGWWWLGDNGAPEDGTVSADRNELPTVFGESSEPPGATAVATGATVTATAPTATRVVPPGGTAIPPSTTHPPSTTTTAVPPPTQPVVTPPALTIPPMNTNTPPATTSPPPPAKSPPKGKDKDKDKGKGKDKKDKKGKK